MKRNKIFIIVFIVLLVGSIFGTVKMLIITQNQRIKDFKLEAANGFDSSVMKDVLLDVEYEIDYLSEMNLKYYNDEIISQEFSEKERGSFTRYSNKVYLSENKILALDGAHYFVVDVNLCRRQLGIMTSDSFLRDENNTFCENIIMKDSDNVYIFGATGWLFKLSVEELNGLETVSGVSVPVMYTPIFVVPDEVDVIVGANVGAVTTVVGAGNISNEGYTLYIYAVNGENGEIIKRETVKKERKDAYNVICADFQSDDRDVVTITDSSGNQDMYFIEWESDFMDCKITEIDVTGILGEDKKICGMFDVEYINGITYICYAEGVNDQVIVNEELAKRKIADIQTVGFYDYSNLVSVEYNGVSVIALKENDLIYQGYLSSESYKGMTDTIIRRIRLIAS